MTAPGEAQPGGGHVRTRREWVVLAIGVVVVAALCVLAGRWQWHRHLDREARIAVVVANFDAAPVPLDEVIDSPGARLNAADEWRTVTVTGNYRAQDTVLLRNRPVSGTPGFHVLVPFEVDATGMVFVVDRGFVPMGDDGAKPAALPDPPAGQVTLTARLRTEENRSSRGAPTGQVQSINTAAVLAATGKSTDWAKGRTSHIYLALASEDPAPTQSLFALPAPSTDPGSHLSYTFQWFVFAAGAIGGFLLLLRRERREAIKRTTGTAVGPTQLALAELPENTPDNVAAWLGAKRPAAGMRGGRKREMSDEEIEDAELDAHGR